MFETFIIQPVFNLMLTIYSVVPGHDFGVSIIIFTLIVRLVLWPLMRKQLHQTRAMKAMQPEIKKIREKTKDDKQKEAQLLMELYKEKGVSPFGSLGIVFMQLPVLIGLFSALRGLADPSRIIRLPYSWVRDHDQVQAMLSGVVDKTNQAIPLAENGNESLSEAAIALQSKIEGGVNLESLEGFSSSDLSIIFNEVVTGVDGKSLVEGPFFNQDFIGIADLSRSAFESGSIYWPLAIVAIISGALQYYQAKQLSPDQDDSRSLKDIFKDEASGKKSEQADINAAMAKNMKYFFPFMTMYFAATFPGALALYWTASSAIAVTMQRHILGKDVEEMQAMTVKKSENKPKKSKKAKSVKSRKNRKSKTKG